MKKCAYCGREYSDTADICAVDAQPLVNAGYSGAPPPLIPRPAAPPLLPADLRDVPPVMNTFSELEQQVLAGGRFVVFQYCFSVLVLSFKRASSIVYLPPGEEAAGSALSHSLISLVAGWWGIPWGPIWTISTIFKNLSGGLDVTQAVLAARVGPVRAAQVMAERRVVPPRSQGMKALRWGLAGAGALLALAILLPFVISPILIGTGLVRGTPEGTSRPLADGQAQFESANRQIGVNQGTVGFGNSPKAVTVAKRFSADMARLRAIMFEGGDKQGGLSLSGHEFLTYCELHDSACAIIVHVPDLRHFTDAAKVSLGDLAWRTAQAALRRQGAAQPGSKLAVGLRGFVLYDRVLTGNVVADPDGPDTGLTQTIANARPEQSLYPFFQPAALPMPAAER